MPSVPLEAADHKNAAEDHKDAPAELVHPARCKDLPGCVSVGPLAFFRGKIEAWLEKAGNDPM